MRGLTIPSTNASFLSKIKVALSRSKAPKAGAIIPARPIDPPIESAIDALQPSRSDTTPVECVPTAISDSTGPLLLQAGPQLPLTINDLPPEILAEIFHAYMFWEDDSESDLINPELEGMISVFVPNPRSAPLLFCGVCGHWRDVAISTPDLWSSIAIYDDFNLETVRLWLKRSQDHPLSLFVSLDIDVALSSTDKLPHLLELLFTNMPRWRHVSFCLPTAKDTQQLLFRLIPEEGISPAVQLQHLYLSVEYHDLPNFYSEALARLSLFPHSTLQRFTWGSYRMPDFPHISKSLWLNLQQISFITTKARTLISFLKACANIRFVNIQCLHAYAFVDSPTTHTVAQNLQALNIGSIEGNITDLCSFLVAPRLKRLSFALRGGHGQSARLREFLERSACTLESLCLICTSLDFDEAETKTMLYSSTFTAIPNFSLRLAEKACSASFPQAIIAETAERWKATAYAYHEPKNFSYHLGWGTLDIARSYGVHYPFLVKQPQPAPKWSVALTDGPLASA
ncbi:hypothetical protein CVT24_010928 [Panaeolus cyanescens]|uniref:Uncharacterized protein n=1 Tax=Panaeolus cyanescens TaxID=181874 RepID=A0A409WAU5_9AGAR|nr:hypothetical protein CVT24_010928 [Panaeolus cyanescens]